MSDYAVAERDFLTGFLSYEQFEILFAEQVKRSSEVGSSFSLVILDLDYFRAFNENYGRTRGNSAIQKTAQIITKCTPDTSVRARFGGEEFIVLFPDIERETAFLTVEKIRSECDAVDSLPDATGNCACRFHLSAGISAFPADGTTMAEILRKAEQALYRAKVTGRNKVCIAQEEKMIPKTAHFTATQLERLAHLAKKENVPEALLLREALDCLLRKYTLAKKVT